jgi:hypothetical protein
VKAAKGTINEALAQVASYNREQQPLAEATMSKKQSLEDFARAVGIDKKEQQWIMDNEDDFGHYHNNSALKKSWLSLSYPIYDNDYYFAFIGDNEREVAKLNAEANRKLKTLARSKMSNEEIFDEMSKLFGMKSYSDVGAGDTMTRDELWRAIQHIRRDYKEETEVEGYEELEEKALVGRMKMMARKILDKMRKRAKKIKLPEAKTGDTCKCCDNEIDANGKCGCDSDCEHCSGIHSVSEETDKYGNPKLSDSDKAQIERLRKEVTSKREEIKQLQDRIHSVKKAAGLPV